MRDSGELERIVNEPPHAEVARAGRWRWEISIVHGLGIWGYGGVPFDCWGTRARADRKARRLLKTYLRKFGRRDQHRVHVDDHSDRALAEVRAMDFDD